MDTNSRSAPIAPAGRRYRSHSPEFKRQLVDASYMPGASVARIAQEHGINANQLFAWRKLFKDQTFAAVSANCTTFLPVAVEAQASATAAEADRKEPCASGTMEITIGKARLTLQGPQDLPLVRAVISELLR